MTRRFSRAADSDGLRIVVLLLLRLLILLELVMMMMMIVSEQVQIVRRCRSAP